MYVNIETNVKNTIYPAICAHVFQIVSFFDTSHQNAACIAHLPHTQVPKLCPKAQIMKLLAILFFHPPLTSSLLAPKTSPSTSLSNTPRTHSAPSVTDQVPFLHKTPPFAAIIWTKQDLSVNIHKQTAPNCLIPAPCADDQHSRQPNRTYR